MVVIWNGLNVNLIWDDYFHHSPALIDHWNQFNNNSNLSNSSWKWATAALCWGQNYKLNIKILVHPRAQTQFPIYINLRIFIHSHRFCLVLFSVLPSPQSVFCPLCPWSESNKLGFILLQISRFSEIEGDQMEQRLCAERTAQYWTQISSHYFEGFKKEFKNWSNLYDAGNCVFLMF